VARAAVTTIHLVAETVEQRRRSGRPRLRPTRNAELAPREEILGAAAGLFVDKGFASTTTREIAERVGIRQASLYHHFSGKDEILLELLTRSVRPSLDVAKALEKLAGEVDDPAGSLYALALVDVQTLTEAPDNIATLYLLPEVRSEAYASFRAERADLQATYGRLGHAARTTPALDMVLTGALLMQLVESVIHLRRAHQLRATHAHHIAAACLRTVGLSAARVTRARQSAEHLLAMVENPTQGDDSH
jgi:AcrR family transcriptional regulator